MTYDKRPSDVTYWVRLINREFPVTCFILSRNLVLSLCPQIKKKKMTLASTLVKVLHGQDIIETILTFPSLCPFHI